MAFEADVFRAHDLLRVDRARISRSGWPSWAEAALERTPWVVVRRARSPEGLVPAGIRGATRSQRFAVEVPVSAVLERQTPEMLADRIGHSSRTSTLPAMAALPMVKSRLGSLRWGPAGSVGFQLATAQPSVSAASDLDLIIRTDDLPPYAEACALESRIQHLSVAIDVLLEMPFGSVALRDLSSGRGSVVLRCRGGARLISVDAPPWAGKQGREAYP